MTIRTNTADPAVPVYFDRASVLLLISALLIRERAAFRDAQYAQRFGKMRVEAAHCVTVRRCIALIDRMELLLQHL